MNCKEVLDLISTFDSNFPMKQKLEASLERDRICGEFSKDLPSELKEYIAYFAPDEEIEFECIGNEICLYCAGDLGIRQDGYSFDSMRKEFISDWPENYFLLGSRGGDPVVYDLDCSEISILEHGMGNWEYGEQYGDSIGQFLLCASTLNFALTDSKTFSGEAVRDDENGFNLEDSRAEWLFPRMKKWAGEHYSAWCSVFDNS
jgi:hypothetical protein